MTPKVEQTSGAVGDTVLVDIDYRFPHSFITVSYFSDAELNTPATPGTGTLAVTGKYLGNQGYSGVVDSPMDCTDLGAVAHVGGGLTQIKVVPAGISVATHYLVTVLSSET